MIILMTIADSRLLDLQAANSDFHEHPDMTLADEFSPEKYKAVLEAIK